MKFGPVPTQAACGTILAHSVQKGSLRIRKGAWLTQADVDALLAAGIGTLTVAQLSSEDLHENAAAAVLAAAIVPDPASALVRLSDAATGRVNIYATEPGIVQIDRKALEAVNTINPVITIATLLPFQRVAAGTMIATVKIIAYGVRKRDIDAACLVGTGSLRVQPPVFQTASLIETQIAETPPATKGRDALQARLKRLGLGLSERIIVSHDTPEIAKAIASVTSDVIFILTGSATSDIADTAPEAVRLAGGDVIHFGMPVDPGNLLFLGAYQGRPVIGLPGCARSIVLNGADWVLERILCGVDVTPTDIAAMGVGGLLKETPDRIHPRGKADPKK